MRPEQSKFVLAMLAATVWLCTAVAVPMAWALLHSLNFTDWCEADAESQAEKTDELTMQKRVFGVFVCVELIVSRCWCAREFWCHLQAVMLSARRDLRTHMKCYMISTVATTFVMDGLLICWILLHDKECGALEQSDAHRPRQLRVLGALCAQVSDVNTSLTVIHLFNILLTACVAGLSLCA